MNASLPRPSRSHLCSGLGARLGPLLLGLLLAVAPGCDRDDVPAEAHPAPSVKPGQLPPLELRDDTPSLLLTWVDEKGDFHVVQKPQEVPKRARGKVRVVVTDREEGTGDVVYVADLRSKAADGSYPVTSMSRTSWDELGAAKRQARLEALAPSAAPPSAGPDAAPAAPQGQLVAVVYGAEWCKPCHDAQRYLRQRGARVEYKDIEASEPARAEMLAKLRKANMPATASIPIIDIAGRLMVGYSPRAIDQALQASAGSQPL